MLGFILLIIGLIYSLIIWCFKDMINEMIKLIEAAAVFVKNNKLILLFPLLAFVIMCFTIFFWGYSTVIAFESKIIFFIKKWEKITQLQVWSFFFNFSDSYGQLKYYYVLLFYPSQLQYQHITLWIKVTKIPRK